MLPLGNTGWELARVGLLGLEPELLEQTATTCGRAPWRRCDIRDRRAVEDSFDYLTDRLGGLDVVVANAGVTPRGTSSRVIRT
ncbi:SDR family oxidoreductase [Rhodococcus koreensis]